MKTRTRLTIRRQGAPPPGLVAQKLIARAQLLAALAKREGVPHVKS